MFDFKNFTDAKHPKPFAFDKIICFLHMSFLVEVISQGSGAVSVRHSHWVIIASGNGLSTVRRLAITRTNNAILSIVPLGRIIWETLYKMQYF